MKTKNSLSDTTMASQLSSSYRSEWLKDLAIGQSVNLIFYSENPRFYFGRILAISDELIRVSYSVTVLSESSEIEIDASTGKASFGDTSVYLIPFSPYYPATL